jgi:ketosteroid isomerase-like protein
MTTKELLHSYYKGYAQKQGWEIVIAEDFEFVGGDMTNQTPVIGKQAYIEITNRFNKLFTDMRPKKMFVTEEGAFVLANYDYVFPGGRRINANVAELWKVKDGKLSGLTIFFDTKNFDAFLNG